MANTEKYSAEFQKDGTILVREGADGKERFRFDLFSEYYNMQVHRRVDCWPTTFITEDNSLLIVGYGIGYLYFISLLDGKIIKQMKLFPEIIYEDDSYLDIDLQGYFGLETRLDFSPDGKYAVIRVRGEFDPQGDGGEFSPVYIRSFFLMDMESLEIVFSDDYSDIPDKLLNLGTVALSPDSRFLVTGALGHTLKVFDLDKKCEVYRCQSLEWVPYSWAVDNRELAVFLDAQTFVFVGKDREESRIDARNIIKVQKQPDGSWDMIQTIDLMPYFSAIREKTVFDIEYDPACREIICYYTHERRKNKSFSVRVE